MSQARVLVEKIRGGDWVRRIGRIVRFVGLTLESTGPDARVGEICEIHARGGRGVTLAEVVGFSEQRVLLMPFGDLQGIEIGSEVIATGRTAESGIAASLPGRNFTLVPDGRVETGGCIVESSLGSLDGRLEVQLGELTAMLRAAKDPGARA